MPRPESSAVFVTWSLFAPSARAGSERPAAATIRRITRPTQKIGEGHEPLPIITNTSVVFTKSRTMATGAPKQTTSEARPAPAASATRSQPLPTTLPEARPDRGHGSLVRRGAPRSRAELEADRASFAIHRSAWKGYSPKVGCTEFSEVSLYVVGKGDPGMPALLVDRDRWGREMRVREGPHRDGNISFVTFLDVKDSRSTFGAKGEAELPALVPHPDELLAVPFNVHGLTRKPRLRAKDAASPALAGVAVADGDADRLGANLRPKLSATTRCYSNRHGPPEVSC